MKNQKILVLISFFGAIGVALIVAGVLYLKDVNRMAKLEKLYTDWILVKGEITSFKVRFPGGPEYAAQDLPIPNSDQIVKQEIYVSGDDDISYFVSATLYPAEVTGDEEENLRKALDGVVKAIPGGEIVIVEFKVPFSGRNYLEYKLHSLENNISYQGRMFLTADSLYQAYVSFPDIGYNDDKYTYFVNSFEIQ